MDIMLHHRLLYKWTLHGKSTSITTDPPTPYKIKFKKLYIDRFGDKNRVNVKNFNDKVHKFSEKFVRPFSYVFKFGNMFAKSHGFVAMPVTCCIENTCSNF